MIGYQSTNFLKEMKQYLRAFFIFLLNTNLGLYSQSNQSLETDNPPNFLFVLVDDQPFDAVGFMGRYPFLKTPNIDR
ncbi:MAG: hypothetical protein CMB96_06480, partial [Flavobacteriaceae bacterium]|nr:hypothetical protein [Flavobacteriaceae bacterium]